MSAPLPPVEQIGRYTIEKLLARGGMAEVFIGSAQGPGGFNKRVVLKRILPELAEDPTFVEMFFNEAKLAALLNHPNIVQVFDFGEHDGQYFLAMEYIEGESLRSVGRYFRKKGVPISPRLAVQIVVGALEGLHYAHGLADEHGASFNIIHRDVTPDNILLSRNGIPKIVDFGIAKAMSSSLKTSAGVIKGKYAYMPPEQIRGEALDRRLDVYAMGVVLYELLSGRRPYQADSELALLNAIITSAPAPLTVINPAIPAELGRIVERAMAKDLSIRYPDARALQGDLEDYLAATGKRVGTVELATLCEEVMRFRKASAPANAPGSHPRGVPGLSPSQATPITLEGVSATTLTAPSDADAVPPPSPRPPTPAAAPIAEPVPTTRSVEVDLGATSAEEAADLRAARGSRLPRFAALAGLVAVGLGAALVLARHHPAADDLPEPVTATAPTPAPAAPPPVPAATPAAAAPQAASPTAQPAPPPPASPVPTPAPSPSAAPAPPAHAQRPAATAVHPRPHRAEPTGEGLLTLRSDPWCDVFLDGAKLGTTPLVRIPVASGHHVLVLRNDGEKALRRIPVDIIPGKEFKQAILFGAH